MRKGGEIPAIQVPMIDFGFITLSSEQQEAYKKTLKQYSGKALESLSKSFSFDEEGNAIGSNSFIPILLNQANLLPEGESLLSLSQFTQAFNTNPEFFKNTYQDSAIILRTNGDPVEKNNYLAKNLFTKLKHRGFTPTPEAPVVISLTDFKKPRQINSSEYGLIYDLKQDAKPVIAPEYGTKESTTRFNIYDERGVPIPCKDGKYTIWKRDAGVSRIYSICGQCAGSDDELFASSFTGGRVVVGKIAVPQKLTEIEKLVSEEEKRRTKIRKNLEDRIAKFKN